MKLSKLISNFLFETMNYNMYERKCFKCRVTGSRNCIQYNEIADIKKSDGGKLRHQKEKEILFQ